MSSNANDSLSQSLLANYAWSQFGSTSEEYVVRCNEPCQRSVNATPDLLVNRGTQTYWHKGEVFTQTERHYGEVSTQTMNTVCLNCTKRHQQFFSIMAEDYFGNDERLKKMFKKAVSDITNSIAKEVHNRYAEIQ